MRCPPAWPVGHRAGRAENHLRHPDRLYLLVPVLYRRPRADLRCRSEEFVNVAWDSAGVTTGPVTVPLVLSMGLGLGNAVSAVEGFGILSMASISPIIAVLATGLWVRHQATRRAQAAQVVQAATELEAV